MGKERKCESYTIFDSAFVGEVEIVIGHSLTAAQPYATWKTYEHTGYQDFQHGNISVRCKMRGSTTMTGSKKRGCITPPQRTSGRSRQSRSAARPDDGGRRSPCLTYGSANSPTR